MRIKGRTRPTANITFQTFFRFYSKLSGMTVGILCIANITANLLRVLRTYLPWFAVVLSGVGFCHDPPPPLIGYLNYCPCQGPLGTCRVLCPSHLPDDLGVWGTDDQFLGYQRPWICCTSNLCLLYLLEGLSVWGTDDQFWGTNDPGSGCTGYLCFLFPSTVSDLLSLHSRHPLHALLVCKNTEHEMAAIAI